MTHEQYARTRFLELFKQRSVLRGDFTLASGQKSNYYLDSRLSILSGEMLSLSGALIYQAVTDLKFQAVGGLEVGAIPLASAVAKHCWDCGREVESFFVRKEAKDHGTKRLIEGRVLPGQQVVIVDDVWTTGESVMKAVRTVEKAKAHVVAIVVLVDRLQGGDEYRQAFNFKSLFSLKDLEIEPDVQ